MSDAPVSQSHMIETTDCLEAVGVFRGWKNFFFLLVVICLLLSQASFWLIDRGIVESPAVEPAAPTDVAEVADVAAVAEAAATDTIAGVEQTPEAGTDDSAPLGLSFLSGLDFEHLGRAIQLINGVLVVTAALYCMAMFFSLMVSLIGRLGGINHISRAFFLALIMLMLVVPWQNLLESSVVGVIFTSGELSRWLPGKDETLINTVLYYLRFSGYWLVVMLLLIMSQIRGARWTKAILRRLEII